MTVDLTLDDDGDASVAEDIDGFTFCFGSASIRMTNEQACRLCRQLNEWFGIDPSQAVEAIVQSLDPFTGGANTELLKQAVEDGVSKIISVASYIRPSQHDGESERLERAGRKTE